MCCSGTLNGKGVKACCQCHLPLVARVTSAAPSEIFCPRCGFLNDGGNQTCVQCDMTIRSTLDKLSSDLRDSTNFLARDMGVNIQVTCPGCRQLCHVPPATACLRCGNCHTYFASPSVGEATNFHVTKLASSISSSFMGLFGQRQQQQQQPAAPPAPQEAPVGRLIALGKGVVRSPRNSPPTTVQTDETRAAVEQETPSAVEEKEEKPSSPQREQKTTREVADAAAVSREAVAPQAPPAAPSPVTREEPPAANDLRSSESSAVTKPSPTPLPPLARSLPVREALPAPPQDIVQVEGDIVEL